MLKEIFTYLTNHASKEARVFGHLYESISLIEKEKRLTKAWKPHRENCKNFILESLTTVKEFNSLLILGSGPLHEIPIEELAQRFKKIFLVDIVHLRKTKKSCLHLKNVFFIEHDISEIEKEFLKNRILLNHIPEKFLDQKWDLVMSINLLSQLQLHFKNTIANKWPKLFSQNELNKFCTTLTSNHLTYLKKFSCPTVIITDIETFFYDKEKKLLDTYFSFPHLSLPNHLREWHWDLSPIPEYSKSCFLQMRVVGIILN